MLWKRAAKGWRVIDEVEDLPVGETQTLRLTLDAGSYALICNIWDDVEVRPTTRWGCGPRSQ